MYQKSCSSKQVAKQLKPKIQGAGGNSLGLDESNMEVTI